MKDRNYHVILGLNKIKENSPASIGSGMNP